MNVRIDPSWQQHIGAEFDKPYFANLASFVKQEYATTTCYPPGQLIFNAFNLCPFDKVKVVIIGQDPYHEPMQAQGLSFSVADGVALPPSLQNIFKEINNDLGKPMPQSGDLTRWARQGVLLLNATLTVRAHQAASHQRHGWEQFTDAVISTLNSQRELIGVRVYVTLGGPTCWIDTRNGEVVCAWGTDRESAWLASEVCDEINSYFEDFLNF